MSELIVRPLVAAFALVPPFIFIFYFLSILRVFWKNELVWSGIGVGAGFGLLAAASSQILEALVPGTITIIEKNLLKAFLQVAIPEELAKLIAILLVGHTALKYEKAPAYLMLGAGVSLGFAALENLFYVIESPDWGDVNYRRAVSAVPGHAFTGIIMGWCVYRFRNIRPVDMWLISLVVPALLHGAYDFPLFMLSADMETVSSGLSRQGYMWFFVSVVLLEGGIAYICIFNICGRETGPWPGIMFPLRFAAIWSVVGIGYFLIALWFFFQSNLLFSQQKPGFSPDYQFTGGFSLFAFLHTLLFLALAIRYFKSNG